MSILPAQNGFCGLNYDSSQYWNGVEPYVSAPTRASPRNLHPAHGWMRKKTHPWVRRVRQLFPTPLLSNDCMILSKLFNLFLSHFPHLKNGIFHCYEH